MEQKILEIFKAQLETDNVGKKLSPRGSIIDMVNLCLGEDIEEDNTTSTWLVTSDGKKIRRITREQYDLIKKFALSGI